METATAALGRSSAMALGRLIARREVSPVEVLEDFLDRHARLNPALNAIVALDAEAARAEAKRSEARALRGSRLGDLDGIPVTVKDNLFVAGMRATWGSRLYRGFRPACDDIGIARLRAAGANIVAKTNTPEFALAAHTDNAVFGPTRNPWDPSLTPGGSSGGAVAALAAGLGPLAVGTDAGGSIRRPAAYTGVVGVRPSTGRIPRAFGFPALAHDFQVVAPAARTVADAYALFRAMAGRDARDRASLAFPDLPLPDRLDGETARRLRIRCVFSAEGAPVDPEVSAGVKAAADVLAGLGHFVEEGAPPWSPAEVDRLWSVLSTAGLARVAARHAGWDTEALPASRATAERGASVGATDYIEALEALQAMRARLAVFFETTDILLTPTSASLPWPLTQPYPERIAGRPAGPRAAAVFATFVNAGGLPAVSVPVAPSASGLPIGMQLAGDFGADVAVLRLAHELEQAAPWAGRWPPGC